jgi:tRNA (cmo5U34)-methyltransferase
VLERFPSGDGFFVDFSEPMLAAARDNLRLLSRKRIIKADFSTAEWIDCVSEPNPMDVLISGFAIHHQPDERKQMLYSEIFSLLSHRYLYLAS